MSAVIVFPKWLERAGAGDVVYHWQLRGYDIGNVAGSRFMHVEPKPATTNAPDKIRLYAPRLHTFWPN